ncbi:SprT family protein [Lactobacillus sp. ESL0731]|uniref:SprT family protein n=1 Tax=unclassified Lactobacillus TaxID=2620435 RepID=UPI0023F67FE0|nr:MULTISPECIES: SprT family protein [unclassified Lactobacillus]WEV51587.1 SprT family protein [Lactobacillus sp. ESL0700]WEV62716.1 SprT family protein [Lactobacillus sp. ESL0731]
MTEEELQRLVEKIALEDFGCPFMHQVKINYRMTTTGGRYHLTDHRIEINAHFLVPKYRQELIGIIKHELTHYFLHLSRRGYHHRDSDFKYLLNKVGGSHFAPDIGLAKRQKRKYLYACQKCGQEYARVRQINIRRYRCGKCGGNLKLVNK